jgi:hypothetical protein
MLIYNSKAVNNPTPILSNVTFTLTAHGARQQHGVNVTDILPAGFFYTPSVGTYNRSFGQ